MTSAWTRQTISNADSQAKLDAISSSSACAEGRVITLDFSAIQHRFGDRWIGRREDVWPKLEAIIEQRVGRGSLWLRMSESEYLVCFADQQAAAAQALGFRAMEEALTHFMGRFEPKDLLVNRVTGIDGQTVSRVPAKPGEPPPASRAVDESKSFAPELEMLATPHIVPDLIDALVLSYDLQDIVNLDKKTVIGLRIDGRYNSQQYGRQLTIAERAALSTRTLVPMDSAIAKALPALFNERSPKTLAVPFSLHTFGTSRGRMAIIEQLKRLNTDQRNRLIIELGGFEAGTPSSRLMEAAAILKPFCRYVGAQPVPTRQGLANVINARFPAISVSARELGGDGARLTSGLLAFGEASRSITPRLMATDLPSEAFLSVCGVAGYKLATVSRDKGLDAHNASAFNMECASAAAPTAGRLDLCAAPSSPPAISL